MSASDSLATTADPDTAPRLFAAIERTRAVLPGHFSLHRSRHAPTAIRFRAIAQDADALETTATALLAQARWDWRDVTVVSPESAGFFLAAKIASLVERPHAVVQTDLRRLPTKRLSVGSIPPGGRVVIVNDVASTGQSLEPIRELVAESDATLAGLLVFAVVQVSELQAYATRHHASVGWSMTARWTPVSPGAATCAGCRDGAPLLPIAEFS